MDKFHDEPVRSPQMGEKEFILRTQAPRQSRSRDWEDTPMGRRFKIFFMPLGSTFSDHFKDY